MSVTYACLHKNLLIFTDPGRLMIMSIRRVLFSQDYKTTVGVFPFYISILLDIKVPVLP